MRCAIIDIGSNTVKMNVYDVTPPDNIRLIISQSATLGLIGYIIDGMLSREGIDTLCKTISGYARLASDISADELRCVATASLRSASNAYSVIGEIKSRTGCNVELISGESEALLSLEGIKATLGDVRSGIMVDMGGGSTELVGFVDGCAVRAVSEPFGCLSLYNEFIAGVLPSRTEIKEIRNYVDGRLSQYDWLSGYGMTLYLVGGTSRLVGRVYRELFEKNEAQPSSALDRDNICSFTREGLKALFGRYIEPSTTDIRLLIRLAPDRIHTFVPGLAALTRIARACSAERIIVAHSGIREGYVKSLLLGKK